MDVEIVLNNLKAVLDEKYQQVNQRILEGHNPFIQFDAQGQFTLETPKLAKNDTERMAILLTEVGLIPVIFILSNIDDVTQFTQSFKHYSVKHHKLKPDQ